MADPATQFQSPGLNVPYVLTPTHYVPGNVLKLDPVNYDAIQRAVSGIPGMLMQSPLNPAVRGQMQAEAARYNLEQNVINDVDKLPPDQRARRVGVSAQGAEIVPGYQLGNMPPGNEPPTTNPATENPTTNAAPAAPGDNTQVNPAPANTNAANVSNVQSATQGGNQQPASQGTGTQPQYAQPQSPYQTPRMLKAPEAPANQPQPAQQPDGRTPTNVPTVQNQPTYMPGAGLNPQQQQQQLTAWQNQNAHPVMSAQDALAWAKQFDTHITGATYLPNGGPGGQPAFAFRSKTGGNNVVPLSQIVQNGGGPLVASQNTSQVLSASDRLGQGQPGQQPPPAAPAQGQPPQGQFTPEQQQYLASQGVALPGGQQGQITNLSASTNNQFLLDRNAQINANNPSRIPVAPNTISDNESNVPRSTISTHENPVPPGETVGQQDQWVQNRLTEVRNSQGGLNGLPDGPNEGQKFLGQNAQGLRWYVDSQNNPKDPDSGIPYLIVNSTPWSEMRMYNTVGTNWITQEVVRPDRLLDHAIWDKTMQDSRDWKLPNGEPDQARKIQTLRDVYNRETTNPMQPETEAKLASMRQQVLQSQRLLDGAQYMSPDDRGWFRGIQQGLAKHDNAFAGMPYADAFLKSFSKRVAPGGVDPRYQTLANAYAALMGGRDDAQLVPEERHELDHISMDDTNLVDEIKQLNHSRMGEYNRYINQAIANRERISDDYLNTANQITNSHRIQDGGIPDWKTGYAIPGSVRAQPTPAPVLQAQPAATPQATPVPNNSQQNPVDLTSLGRQGGIQQALKLPSKTWVKSGNQVFQTP